jgi:ABC-type xylose transport system permease subunit
MVMVMMMVVVVVVMMMVVNHCRGGRRVWLVLSKSRGGETKGRDSSYGDSKLAHRFFL